MSNVTPIRPGSDGAAEPPAGETGEPPIERIHECLRQVRAIADLIQFSDHRALDEGTVSSAVMVMLERIYEVEREANKLDHELRELRDGAGS